MKPDYKNWMPKGMVLGTLAGAAGCLGLSTLSGCTGLISNRKCKAAATAAFLLAGAAAGGTAIWMWTLYRAFAYNGKRQMSRQIIDGVAEHVKLPETLRVLKKGGAFAIHDLFSKDKYGDMQAFVRLLREMGYEKVELIDTTNGKIISPREAKWMALSGSALLLGKK